jgi:squalene-associated FAD-dependent desaturase
MVRSVHIIGGGLAGLAAGVRLASAGTKVRIHEATNQAGGRCRSYHDPILGITIDNGNHLVLSGNHATMAYLRKTGSENRLTSPPETAFPFIDLATHERWALRPNEGAIPWWIFDPGRRVPNTRAWDYIALLRLLWANPEATIGDVYDCSGPLYDRLIRPLLLAALNIEPREGSAKLASAIIRETLAAGGRACRPLIAADGLSSTFILPAIKYIEKETGTIAFGNRLNRLIFDDRRVTALDFGEEIVRLGQDDAIVLAVPPTVAASLLPGLQTPTEFRAIVNAHFRTFPRKDAAPITGVVNGIVEWLFIFSDRLSVTISNADRLLTMPRETLAQRIWQDVSQITGVEGALPPWQIVRERRATFAALPREDARRPPAKTQWENLVLAGDWIAGSLPATIEGAIRSGNRAAEMIVKQS